MLCMLFGVPIPQALPEPMDILIQAMAGWGAGPEPGICENLWTLRGFQRGGVSLRVQISNNHMLTPNLYHNHYYPKPQYLIIGYLDPLGTRAGMA